MARTILTSLDTPNTNNAALYSTSSFVPGANGLVLAFVAHIRSGGGAAAAPTAQGNNLTWEQIATIQVPGSADHRLTCFRAMGPSPTQGQLTFNFAGQQQTLCAWSVFEYDDVAGTGAVLQPQTVTGNGQSLSRTLGALADPARSLVAGGIMLSNNVPMNPGAGFQEIYDRSFGQGGDQGTLQTQDATGTQTISWTWAGTENAAAIVLEIKAAAAVAPPPQPMSDLEKLVRRFEPVLLFHPGERFFPSDAKRYLEACALWKAAPPFDLKDCWGGKGQAFPRFPIIPKGKIVGVQNEPGGTFLGDPGNLINLTVGEIIDDDRFLDLTGWTDAARAAMPGVTETSKNTYAHRDAIAKLYSDTPEPGVDLKLSDSKYWYHAELLEGERLRALLSSVKAPDLVRVLDSPELKNPALLNYYFFFPAHEEELAAPCDNTEAKEIACFAGEWACMSLLLERGGPNEPFRPTYIGRTGRNLKGARQALDGQGRTFMEVLRFQEAELDGEPPNRWHPRLYVAKGTHSLYLRPGTYQVFPTGLSYNCGRLEGLPATPSLWESAGPGLAPLWKSLLGSGLVPGLGLVAGALWGIEEINDHVDEPCPPSDQAPLDETLELGTFGRIVRPKDVVVPDGALGQQEWRSKQGHVLGGRRYDFLVDRATQVWWPREDIDEQGPGYQGRWGPLVEGDRWKIRAGMRFPPFWWMFFIAFALGKEDGTI